LRELALEVTHLRRKLLFLLLSLRGGFLRCGKILIQGLLGSIQTLLQLLLLLLTFLLNFVLLFLKFLTLSLKLFQLLLCLVRLLFFSLQGVLDFFYARLFSLYHLVRALDLGKACGELVGACSDLRLLLLNLTLQFFNLLLMSFLDSAEFIRRSAGCLLGALLICDDLFTFLAFLIDLVGESFLKTF